MKFIYVIILFLFPYISFSQVWKYQKVGNNFDGFAKAAAVQIKTIDDQQAMLAVLNTSDELNLTWGINKKNGINYLSIRVISPNDIIPEKILMAFDNEKTYYELNFSYSEKKIFIENAFTPDFKYFLSTLDIISFFKSKKTVHFRMKYQNEVNDFNFPLLGSAGAINQVFLCPTYKRAGNWTDATFELMAFTEMFSKVDGGKNNYISVAPNCIEYLDKNKGSYFFTQIKTIETSTDDQYMLDFKNKNDEIVEKMKKEVCLKNLFFFSGNPKLSNNKKDIETLKIYYKGFQEYTNLITDKISFDQFSNLTRKDLILYYNSLLKNIEFLDYMRADKSIYYFYEVNEYTFDVFIEPWGT